MSGRLIDDCFEPTQRSMPHAEAVAVLAERTRPVVDAELVPLAAAQGRILASSAVARFAVPSHTNSAVDGYAFAHSAYTGGGADLVLPIAGRAAAGHPFTTRLPDHTAVRIFTGAVLPEGADTIVMQEDTRPARADAKSVTIPAGLKLGANVRKAGEDVAAGTELFTPGDILRAQDLATLASIGLAEVECYQRLRVAILSSGDEVIRPGTADLKPGQVFDANAPMLQALASTAGAEVTDLGILPDRADTVRTALADAASRYHVILTSGGASLGDEDHMAATLATLGRRHFWQIKVKPGRPMMLGQIGDAAVVGLPGNPVAVFVCFLMYVWPMLRRLGGGHWQEPRRLMLPAAFAFEGRKKGRREFWRGRLVDGSHGLAVDKFERDSSGLISSLRQSNCLIDIPEETSDVAPGDTVAVIPFTEFGIPDR